MNFALARLSRCNFFCGNFFIFLLVDSDDIDAYAYLFEAARHPHLESSHPLAQEHLLRSSNIEQESKVVLKRMIYAR
jgi:hypothetical protein